MRLAIGILTHFARAGSVVASDAEQRLGPRPVLTGSEACAGGEIT